MHARHRLTRLAVGATFAFGLATTGATLSAAPAAASHLTAITVTQVGNQGAQITLQVDVTYSGTVGGGVFDWSTGDGRSGWISDGVSNGVYMGDASGSGAFSGGSGKLSGFTWSRTQPGPNVARTNITYYYGVQGVYQVDWSGCCPAAAGTLPVSTAASLAECSDGVDNDGDGSTDHPTDPGCNSEQDDSELAECPDVAPGVVACIVPGPIVVEKTVYRYDASLVRTGEVVGYVDRYRFVVGTVVLDLPCVTLAVNGRESRPCAIAGGEFIQREQTLVTAPIYSADITPREPIATLAICTAEIEVTVREFGVRSAPGYTLCVPGGSL